MKHKYNLNNLFAFLEKEEIPLSVDQKKKLEYYHDELVKYGQYHRIISHSDIGSIVERHFLSSFYFIMKIKGNLSKKDQVIDLGTGAGFPGLLLSIYFNKNRIILLDSVRKKTLFVGRIVKNLNLNALVINERIEAFSKQNNDVFRIVTARALANMDQLLTLAGPFLNGGAELHTMKGNDYLSELKSGHNGINILADEIKNSWKNETYYLNTKMYIKARLV